MPVNRNALIRYKTIDKCLQNRFRRWTLEDLIGACSEALYEYEGIEKGVSKRSVQADIQIMRSDKLGYNAPIVVVERKYYTYEDADYSITNIPLTDQDLNHLTDTVNFLKQFKGFSHFRELEGMVQKLEGHIYAKQSKQKVVIDFEKNENLKGLEHLDALYQAIVKRQVLEILYQSFKAKKANWIPFHPYLLKEYNNRWFLLGVKGAKLNIMTIALDRIQEIRPLSEVRYLENENFDPELYYKDIIGVTVQAGLLPEEVDLFFHHSNAPYVLTKPMHPSQELIEQRDDGVVIRLKVKQNFELEREIMGYGESVVVLKPQRLRQRILQKMNWALENYEKE